MAVQLCSVSEESVQRVQCSRVEFVHEFMLFSIGQKRQLKPENKKEPEDLNKLPELVEVKKSNSVRS